MSNIVKRPWGSYLILAKSKIFLIKKIKVNPGGILSYQSHKFRSEHWIIIKGKAKIIIQNKKYIRKANENIFIKKNYRHRVINESKKNELILIEVQTGKKFLETDIKRFSDIYGRVL